jgi:hypothetical protein
VRLNFGNGRTVSLRDTVDVVLPPNNWTDFALPYGGTFREYLGDILNATGRPAADSLQFYHWVRSGTVYTAHLIHAPVLTVDTFMNPHFQLTSEVSDGYTVYNPLDAPVTLRIPPICAPMSLVKSLPSRPAKAAMPAGAWALTLRAELADGVVLGPIVLGYAPRAGAAMSGYPLAPTFADAGVRLFDRHTGFRYGHLVWHRAAGDGVGYELEFYNDGDGPRRVRFHIDGAAALGEGAFVTLGDPQTGALQPVTGTLTVDVPARSSVYRILTVGGAGYHTVVYANVQPLAQFGVFPNPFRAGLTVQFMLPADVGRVEYRLVDPAGRLVWRRAERAGLRAGMNRVCWDGTARAGVYVLDVAVFDKAGRPTAVRRQPVMRLP